MRRNRKGIKRLFACILIALALSICLSQTALAGVGIVVYGSRGMDARRTESGHIALIVTDLCARGIDQVRECTADEPQGVVIMRYPSLAPDYDKTIIVVPLTVHLLAVDSTDSLPVLTSEGTLADLQIAYWRAHLKPYLPAFSPEHHAALLKERSEFHAGRFARDLATLAFLGKLFGGRQHSYSGDAIALKDPSTGELIPNGSWRSAIGAEHVRSATIITLAADRGRELRLVEFIERSQHESFNTLSNNCADFVEQALLTVFASEGMHVRPQWLDPADVWITTPLVVATSFIEYANKRNLPLSVSFMPILAGTARATPSVKSIARGALVPAPNQGKLAFALKSYINFLNPLIGTTAFAVEKLSRFSDLNKLVHERDGSLSQITNGDAGQLTDIKAERRSEQVRRFGTSSCWKAKRGEFATLTAHATEAGALTKVEHSQLLSSDRPFLLPRYYEKLADAQQRDGPLMNGIEASLGAKSAENSNEGFAMRFLPSARDEQRPMVPSRLQIRSMAESSEPQDLAIAFRLMVSVINYDLASEPRNRRTAAAFDKDWQLFLQVAEGNYARPSTDSAGTESVEACSIREFQDGTARVDAIQDARAPLHRIFNGFRELVVSPTR